MSDPALAMQAAVINALRGSAALRSIVAERVYDYAPGDEPGATTTFPYVSFGESTTESERADCLDGTVHTFTVYAWSQAKGYPESKRIAAAIRDALHEATLSVEGFNLHDLACQTTDYARGEDGQMSVATLSFRALLDPLD